MVGPEFRAIKAEQVPTEEAWSEKEDYFHIFVKKIIAVLWFCVILPRIYYECFLNNEN